MAGFRAFSSGIAGISILLLLLGCDGDTGLSGRQGEKGQKGDDGIDSERMLPPPPRYLSLGIVNGSIHALAATEPTYVTFDTTVLAGGDTIVANRLSIPPLLDGIDGGIAEWGTNKSVLRLSPQPVGSSDGEIPDPHIYKASCRVGYDDEYLYVFMQWREMTVIRDPQNGTSNPIVAAGASRQVNTLFLDISHPEVVKHTESGTTQVDTIFTNFRVRKLITLDSVCFPPPPWPPIICDYVYDTTYETLFVWKTLTGGEDKVAVCWSMQESKALNELHELVFASDSITLLGAAANEHFDLWRWGAGTSEPVCIADDWSIRSGKIAPDDGNTPFVSNWMPSDSIPRLMNRLDPNYITNDNPWILAKTLWYFDAVPYIPRGWTEHNIVYIPGIIATIPSRSRADVMAHGTYAENSWTIEFKRARKTGNGDDLQF